MDSRDIDRIRDGLDEQLLKSTERVSLERDIEHLEKLLETASGKEYEQISAELEELEFILEAY